MDKILNLTYASSLTELCEINSSFDKAVLKIAYWGENRNKTYISKETFEKCLKTIYNCPVVCNYDRETDDLGGHDVAIVKDPEGNLRFVNLTTPVGVVPQNTRIFWEKVTEEDGSEHEYLCAEVLIWKRQEAYRKIKKDGISKQSMEISVNSATKKDGIYYIEDFEFTAFVLIGVEPCFESASLEFSKDEFKEKFSQMMQEFKESFSVNSSQEVDINDFAKEGGTAVLKKKNELLEKYGLSLDDVADISLEEISDEEFEKKLIEIKASKEADETTPSEDEDENEEDENEDEEGKNDNGSDEYALNSNVLNEIYHALSEVKIDIEGYKCTRYWFVDFDLEKKEIYVRDAEDGLLYGFMFEFTGDKVKLDFESKKRMKFAIVEFEDGDPTQILDIKSEFSKTLKEVSSLKEAYQKLSDEAAIKEAELDELRKFKAETESEVASRAREEVISKFSDLEGNEEFESLKANLDSLDVDSLTEKLYAIRGKNMTVKTFSAQTSTTIKVEKSDEDTTNETEPYGGLFVKYKTI